jgi:hypothetical protein
LQVKIYIPTTFLYQAVQVAVFPWQPQQHKKQKKKDEYVNAVSVKPAAKTQHFFTIRDNVRKTENFRAFFHHSFFLMALKAIDTFCNSATWL